MSGAGLLVAICVADQPVRVIFSRILFSFRVTNEKPSKQHLYQWEMTVNHFVFDSAAVQTIFVVVTNV